MTSSRTNDSHRVELLGAIKTIFDKRVGWVDEDRISTSDLIETLAADDEMWWSEWWDPRAKNVAGEFVGGPAKGAPRKLAGILKNFEIHSDTIRFEDKTRRGYYRDHFADVFSRYLSPYPAEPVTSETSATGSPRSVGVSEVSDVSLFPGRGALADGDVDRLLRTHRPELIGRDDITTPAERRQVATLLNLYERSGLLSGDEIAA